MQIHSMDISIHICKGAHVGEGCMHIQAIRLCSARLVRRWGVHDNLRLSFCPEDLSLDWFREGEEDFPAQLFIFFLTAD